MLKKQFTNLHYMDIIYSSLMCNNIQRNQIYILYMEIAKCPVIISNARDAS